MRGFYVVFGTLLVCGIAGAQLVNPIGKGIFLSQPWSMDHSTAARTGKSQFTGPSTGAVVWQRAVGGRVYGIAADQFGRAFLGVTFYEAIWSNELYSVCYDITGEISWRVKVAPYVWGFSQGVRSFPTLRPTGETVVNSGLGQLLRFDSSGNVLQIITGMSNATNDNSPALLPDFSIVHFQVAQLRKHAPDGSIVWSAGAFSQSDPAVAYNGDVALGGVRSTEPHGSLDVSYYNANGTLRWSKSSTYGTNTQVCFGPDGTLYTTVGGTTAYNSDGSIKWSAATGGFGTSLDGLGRVLVPSGNRVTALNKDSGTQIWTTVLPFSGSIVGGLTIDRSDRIYVTSTSGYAACLNSDGTLAWSTKVCDEFTCQPSISSGATIYAAGKVGYSDFYLFRIR